MIDEIHDSIIDILDEVGSDIKFKVTGSEYTLKSAIVDPASFRNRENLPDWMSEMDYTVYVSFKSFESLGLLQSDIKNISDVEYKNNLYTTIKASPFGILENSFAYVMIGLSR